MTKFKAVIKQVRLDGGEWMEYTEPKFEKMDISKIKGGKGDEEAIKKNRCSDRLTAVDILDNKLNRMC